MENPAGGYGIDLTNFNAQPTQQPMMNPYLANLCANGGLNGYGFGVVANAQTPEEKDLAHMSITPQENNDPAHTEAVGLAMGGLVNTEVTTQQPTPQNVYGEFNPAASGPIPFGVYGQFNGLIQQPIPVPESPVVVESPYFGNLYDSTIDPADIKQRFGVAPLEDGVDRSMLPKENSFDLAHLNKNNQPVQETVGRKVNNWFTRLLDQRGQDYISSGKLTIDEVNRNAERILDDIIAGRIDYGKQGQYLINPVVIDTLISYCANKLAINRAIQYSLGYVYNDYTNRYMINDPERIAVLATIDDSQSRNISQSIAIVNQDIGIYEILHQKLQYVAATRNASSLFSITNDLNNWRKQTKKRY